MIHRPRPHEASSRRPASLCLCLTIMLAWAALPAIAGDAPALLDDRHCHDCHGKDGISTDDTVPVVAGASSFLLAEAIYAFQEQDRPCREGKIEDGSTVNHCEIVEGISEDDQEAIGDYYAALPFVAQDNPHDEALATAGAKLHEDLCEKCHTKSGSVADDDAGILAGQWSAYLRATMKDYLADDRYMPDKMAKKMEGLTDEDVEALINFYAQAGAR